MLAAITIYALSDDLALAPEANRRDRRQAAVNRVSARKEFPHAAYRK